MTTPLRELLAAPLQPDWTIDNLAEQMLAIVANEPAEEQSLTNDELTDQQSQQLIQPLLTCLARISETATSIDSSGGALSFVRKGKSGDVQITGEFENHPGAIRLILRRPKSTTSVDSPPLVRPALSRLIDLLVPEVLHFRVEKLGFALADDLDRLDRVRAVGAHEAAVLYCTRVLEAMVRSDLSKLDQQPSEDMGTLLTLLVKYRNIPEPLSRWLHDLRKLGNDARHVNGPVSEADADVAFIVLLKWLHWWFCEAIHRPNRPNLTSLTVYNRPADALLPRKLARLMDDADADGEAVLAQLNDPDPSESRVLSTPMVPAAAAASLLARGRLSAAWQILEAARPRFPRDLRLRQLRGLYWSRRGMNERSAKYLLKARKVLTSVLPKAAGSTEDEETFGILAGVYKRLAELDPARGDNWLKRSLETYWTGWQHSRRTNTYLGINTASMALLQGLMGERVKRVAREIRDRIAGLQEQFRTSGSGDRPLTYWDQVTWAEAELLQGEWQSAGELYRDAFDRFATQKADIASTVTQSLRILDRLGRSELAGEILGRWLPTQ